MTDNAPQPAAVTSVLPEDIYEKARYAVTSPAAYERMRRIAARVQQDYSQPTLAKLFPGLKGARRG